MKNPDKTLRWVVPMADSVLILGGGLAGVSCALQLGDEGVDVTLVDRNDYHQFQPLLYQVASSQLPAEDIARPHRTIFKAHPSVQVSAAALVQARAPGAQPPRRRPLRRPGRRAPAGNAS